MPICGSRDILGSAPPAHGRESGGRGPARGLQHVLVPDCFRLAATCAKCHSAGWLASNSLRPLSLYSPRPSERQSAEVFDGGNGSESPLPFSVPATVCVRAVISTPSSCLSRTAGFSLSAMSRRRLMAGRAQRRLSAGRSCGCSRARRHLVRICAASFCLHLSLLCSPLG